MCMLKLSPGYLCVQEIAVVINPHVYKLLILLGDQVA